MSFFGQSSNQQSSGGFGGFGSNNTPGTGFGQSSNTGFGASSGNTGGGLFGAANNNTSTNTGFGGFGATGSTSSPFGGTTAFGTNTSSGGGMFGSNTATASNSSGFGGFGGNTANTGGSLFGGASKPAFGAQQPSTGGSLFGGGSNAFGSNNQTTGAFGAAAPSSTALATNVAECQGTGSTPFQAFSEKDTPSGTQTNHFQSITFMQPYKNYSFEELRLADYNQGRRYGNGSGQAGAFGTNTGFGGFGGQNTTGGFGNNNQSTGLFGSQTTSASPFGGATTAASGFGATNTGGGLFGGAAAKPGGFGTAASQPTGGGLFGNTNQSGGFGAQNNTTNTTGGFGSNQGGGLFGNNNNQQKSGFSFGQNNNTSTGTGFGASANTGFGANNNTSTGGGIFGNNSTNAPFGGGQQQQPASNPFGGFGNNQQNQNQTQNTTAPAFGGFGNNNQQQKSGGLFGSTDNSTNNTGGGLFGNNQNNQQPTTGGGLFGNANTNQTGGSSLFGPKPAATGTNLFGNTNASNTGNTGGGLFGSNTNQNQQNQSGGLFNTGNQQQQKPGGIFGTGTGSNLFGNNNNNQQQGATSSIFGGGLGSTNQQQQSGGLFGTGNNNNNTSSLFNNSQQQQQQPQNNPLQAPQAYNASIFDPNPYGNRSIFDGLPPPPQQYTGPIATPIGQKGQPKKPAVLPQYRINPHVASRFVTPQKRQGYGFSYSTYGTPSSVSSNVSTPGGLGGSSLLHGSITRSLGKSLSTNNLRRSFDTEGESLLSPGAFSAGSSRYHGTGSLKKLTIDRSLRTDLFSAPPPLPNLERSDQTRQPGILKKKVSFDASTVGGNGDGQNGVQMNGINGVGSNGEGSKSPTSEQGSSAPAQPNGYQNGSRDEDAPAQRDMEQVKGNELAVINEDGDHDLQLPEGSRQPLQPSQLDPQPGAYYMKPSFEEVAKMSFEQKKKVPDVCIGREKCGFVTFDRPVNLNEVPMDHIFGEIAQISHRSLTVYPDAATKPAVGKGLNVPSTIYLANSWPRAKDRKTPLYEKSGDRFNKHILRLRKVRDTEFVRYDADTGTWVFKVKHFTTYGLDYDDEGSEGDSFQTSTLSAPPDSPTPPTRLPRAGSTPMPTGTLQDSSLLSSEWSQSSTSPDDTFEFRRKKILPGAFDATAGSDEEPEQDQPSEMAEIDGDNDSFLDGRSAASTYGNGAPSHRSSTNHLDRSQSLVVRKEQHDMAGSFPNLDGGSEVQITAPKSLLDDSQAADFLGTPAKREFNTQGDWAEELRRTISPRKQDRQALRESQARVLQYADNRSDSTPKANIKAKALQPGFATAMDLMHSLNPQEPERRKKGKQGAVGQAKAFQYPYPKNLSNMGDDSTSMREDDWEWHASFKPSWGPEATLVYAMPSTVGSSDAAVLQDSNLRLVSEGRDVRFARFIPTPSLTPNSLSLQKSRTVITTEHGVPLATPQQIPFRDLAAAVGSGSPMEKSAWTLASILFDELQPGDLGSARDPVYEHRIRKDLLSSFWSSLCADNAQKAVTSASSAEERAIAHLTANDIVKACEVLIEAKDFHLATLIAQLPADQIMAEDMAGQIDEWRKLCVLSEVTEPIRALYELCAGKVGICEGKKGPVEDQAKTFVISQRFGLEWERTFGLRLWYATGAEESIEAAVTQYYNDMRSDEPIKPIPAFTKHATLEDILWGLLKLFAALKDAIPFPSLADIIAPRNVTDDPADFRFAFQLHNGLVHLLPTSTDQATFDRLSHDFATQLESQGEWLWSIFVLLHLSDSEDRRKAIQNTLSCHARSIAPDETAFPFSHLISDFKIPARWIWEAKALEARSISQDHVQEITYLQNANNWHEAHQTLCRTVGPQCIIEQDYDTLAKLLDGFGEGASKIAEAWQYGGEIYEDFLDLIKSPLQADETEEADRGSEKDSKAPVVERLLDTLPSLVRERQGQFAFEEGIAIREIASEVASVIAKGGYKDLDASRILQLPLTDVQRRRLSAEMTLNRFRDAMRGSSR